jgi:phosphoribosylaminoimidazole-succinocarboxamide synthase
MNEPGQQMPEITDEYAQSVSERYIELYEHITGERFEYTADSDDIAARIEQNVARCLQYYKTR